jgi:hypothetical protein
MVRGREKDAKPFRFWKHMTEKTLRNKIVYSKNFVY